MHSISYQQRLKVAFQYVMPQLYLTRFAGWFAKQKWGMVTHFAIKAFAKKYNIDMSIAQKEQFSDYASFNEFFIRPLKENARPINQNPTALCLPADGRISECGHIDDNRLLQAKGHFFRLDDLLAEDKELVEAFKNGEFATTYLSPRDYHRVHMPCDGTLRKMIYVPGDLFSVNPFLAQHVPNLFARNERVICVFDTEFGSMVQILVGATITASIGTTTTAMRHLFHRTADKLPYSVYIFLRRCFNAGKGSVMYRDHGHTIHNIGLPFFSLSGNLRYMIHINSGNDDRINLDDHTRFLQLANPFILTSQ